MSHLRRVEFREGILSTDFPVPTGRAPDGGPSRLPAVLWDMDGTLVDTEPYWIETEYALADELGGTWSEEHALNLVGNDLLSSGRYIRTHMFGDAPEAPEPAQIVELLLDGVVTRVQETVPWRPGARELLLELSKAGVPCALVTMSYRRFVDPILLHLPPGTFSAIVTGDIVSHGKPHPEPYLKAAAELGVPASECLAIEDSNTGARSAESAGCTVLCVPHHVPVLAGERRVFLDTLQGATPAHLQDLLRP